MGDLHSFRKFWGGGGGFGYSQIWISFNTVLLHSNCSDALKIKKKSLGFIIRSSVGFNQAALRCIAGMR